MRTGTFYEINVTKDGKFVFATDSTIRNTSEHDVVKMLKLFKEKFPSKEGYNFGVTCWQSGCSALPEGIKKELRKS